MVTAQTQVRKKTQNIFIKLIITGEYTLGIIIRIKKKTAKNIKSN